MVAEEVQLAQANRILKVIVVVVSVGIVAALYWAVFHDVRENPPSETLEGYMKRTLVIDLVKHYEITPDMVINYQVLKGVSVTPYTNRECETDSTPNIGAEGKMVCEGTIALSQDLYRVKIFPGDIVYVKKLDRYFEALDTMNIRHKDSCDVFFYKRRLPELVKAAIWGKSVRSELHVLRIKK